jgi:hypothetical protein
MPRPRSSVSLAGALHWLTLAGVYARLALKGLLHFPTDWDFLAYHLPGALASYGLTSYTPEPRLRAVIAGFPPLSRLVQGALILLTGRFSAAGLLNLVGFAALVAGLAWLFGRGISLRWFLTAVLGVPLIALHLASGYVDLFAGSWLALALAAVCLVEAASEKRIGAAWLAVGALALAMLSKFQTWPIAALNGAALVYRLLRLTRVGAVSPRQALTLTLVLAAALGTWPVRNLIRFHNPVYPVVFPLAPGLFPNAIVDADSGVFNLPHWLADASRPERFAVSVLELNRTHSGERFAWSLDQAAQGDPAHSPHHRLGGWFPWTLAALLAGTLLARLRGRAESAPLVALAGSLVAVACLPQGHELRYWLYAPLSLAVFSARGMAAAGPAARACLGAVLVLGAAFVLFMVRPFEIDARAPAELAPARAVAFWAAQQSQPSRAPVQLCDVNPDGIFYAGPTFREYRVIACFGHPDPLSEDE